MEENKTWFEPKHLPDWSKGYNAIEKMASITKAYKRMGFNVRNYQWEMSYDSYKAAQAEAHRVYGCNLKRALRKFGLKNRVRHKTRNDRWVWMKQTNKNMETNECKGCGYCRVINGKLYCTFQGFVCAVEFINYCQKNEREED